MTPPIDRARGGLERLDRLVGFEDRIGRAQLHQVTLQPHPPEAQRQVPPGGDERPDVVG